MKKYIQFLMVAFFGCSNPQELPQVSNIGELRLIMHQGRFEARVKLDTLVSKGTYGLGAIDSLTGELLVIDGEVFKSQVKKDSVITQADQSSMATLFVYSSVSSWDTLEFSGISDIEIALSKYQLLTKPFPFILIGSPGLQYHIINFDPINGDFSRHKEGAFSGSFEDELITILGFHSKNAKGIYTHHDSNLHMHVINEEKTIMGHIDQIDLKGGSYKLLIPKQ
jgi:acetolactate decarboxylase